MNEQIAFSFDGNEEHNLSEFIESSSNKNACAAITNWQNNWGVKPYPKVLILKGPKASGKTYLAKRWAVNANAIFIKKTHELTESILNHSNAFIIDGFDNSYNEEKTLHQFNAIHEAGKYLLITTENLPDIKLPDLKSRIMSANIVNIELPDDELIKVLIFKLFSNYSVVVSEDVISYLIKHLSRNFVDIVYSINKINEHALQKKRKITVPLVKDII